jgi:segregation and condensation protein A
VNNQAALNSENIYQVNTDLFAGPLSLLLDLIERSELDITTVALAQVTDQYLSYLEQLETRDPSEVSSFLVIAAKLLLIKSIHLLPRPPVYAVEEEDAAEQLVQQLKLYKKFKKVSQFLETRQNLGYHTFVRVSPPEIHSEGKLDMSGVSLQTIFACALEIFTNRSGAINLDEVVAMPRVTIREKIKTILEALSLTKASTFEKMLKSGSRIEIVITFLALLELIKRQIIEVNQIALFEDIELRTSSNWQYQDELQLEFEDE